MASATSFQPHYDVEGLGDRLRTLSHQDDYWKYMPLRRAATEGDWEKAKKFFEENPEAVTANVNLAGENALQVAVQAGNKAIDFVKHLLEKMTIEALEHKNKFGQTVLISAAFAGNMRAAAILEQKHRRLLYIPDDRGRLPVHVAAEYDQKDTFKFLLSITKVKQDGVMPFEGESGASLVTEVIFSGYYDQAVLLIKWFPNLVHLLPKGDSILSAITSKASAFRSGSHLSFWEKVIYACVPVVDKYIRNILVTIVGGRCTCSNFSVLVSKLLHVMLYEVLAFLVPPIKHIGDKKQEHYQATLLVKVLCEEISDLTDYEDYVKGPLLSAAKLGVKEVVEEILYWFPDAAVFTDEESHYAFTLAILNRQEKVFNVVSQMDQLVKQIVSHLGDKADGMNNVLHLAARLPPLRILSRIPGAALQMQRELQWFKEVEKFVPPKYRLQKNNEGKIPTVLFTEQHEKLVNEGAKWMKDAANSCTIVASLIATIAFAAAITGPGGNDDKNGLPIFSKESAFIIFAISNALSLFTSATSLLMFLSIMTSRYEEGDFLYVLPKRLIIGLVTLFLSITSMMVAFTATLYLVVGKYKEWILIPTVALASVPIYIFVFLQFPLLLDLIHSTYGTIFGK